MSACGTCGTPENFPADSKSELRPYGPGGTPICYRCAFATPDAEKQTGNAFAALLDANEVLSPTGTTVLTPDGPAPFDARLIDPDARVLGVDTPEGK